jgi:hypothetical protein
MDGQWLWSVSNIRHRGAPKILKKKQTNKQTKGKKGNHTPTTAQIMN